MQIKLPILPKKPLRYYFGPPVVYFTVTPCDKCSFRLRLHFTDHEHILPSIYDVEDKAKCLLDFNARKTWRARYPGAYVIEHGGILQVLISVFICWDQEKHKGSSRTFGVSQVC